MDYWISASLLAALNFAPENMSKFTKYRLRSMLTFGLTFERTITDSLYLDTKNDCELESCAFSEKWAVNVCKNENHGISQEHNHRAWTIVYMSRT